MFSPPFTGRASLAPDAAVGCLPRGRAGQWNHLAESYHARPAKRWKCHGVVEIWWKSWRSWRSWISDEIWLNQFLISWNILEIEICKRMDILEMSWCLWSLSINFRMRDAIDSWWLAIFFWMLYYTLPFTYWGLWLIRYGINIILYYFEDFPRL